MPHVLKELSNEANASAIWSIWATVLALKWLETHFANNKEEWDMVAGKAKRWLKKECSKLSNNLKIENLLALA